MELNFNRKEKIVGTFIIVIVVLMIAVIITIGRGKDWFKTYNTYYTDFNQSYNLKANTPVKLFNANIGKVKKIHLVGDKVEVTLKILKEQSSRIRVDSIATVESPTFIGSEYIAIIPGNKDSPLIPNEGMIHSKAKKSISDYMNEFQVEKTAKMVIKAAQEITKIIQVMRDPKGPLFTAFAKTNKTLDHIEKITRNIESGKGTLGNILTSEALLDQIRGNLNKVGDILGNISVASAKIPDTVNYANDNLSTMKTIENGILERIPDIKKILKDVEKTVVKLKITVSNMEKGSYDVPKVTRSAVRGIHEIRSAVENIDKVVESLKQNFLIKPNLPPEPEGINTDTGLRP